MSMSAAGLLYLVSASSFASAWTLCSIGRRNIILVPSAVAACCFTAIQVKAACMPGDLTPSCIGVYKIPVDTVTREQLELVAPDVKFVRPERSPTSLRDAISILQAQRLAADDISAVVMEGHMEEAGIKVLNLLSKLSTAGGVAVAMAKRESNAAQAGMSSDSKRAVQQLVEQRIDQLFEAAEDSWKSTDLGIGQGIRGELGVAAVAQLRALADVREATAALDDFLTEVSKLDYEKGTATDYVLQFHTKAELGRRALTQYRLAPPSSTEKQAAGGMFERILSRYPILAGVIRGQYTAQAYPVDCPEIFSFRSI